MLQCSMVIGNRGLNGTVRKRGVSEEVVVERMDVERRVEGRVYYKREKNSHFGSARSAPSIFLLLHFTTPSYWVHDPLPHLSFPLA